MTAVTFNQLVGLIIGVGGLSATWWMNVMRNRREAERRKEERDEHELRMRQIIYTPERRTRSEDEL